MIITDDMKIRAYLEFNNWVRKVYKELRFNYTFREFENIPELWMDIICLHFIDKMTFREIGEIYGFSRSNAQSKLYQAFRKLNRGDFKIK